jgi:hypothetical protein
MNPDKIEANKDRDPITYKEVVEKLNRKRYEIADSDPKTSDMANLANQISETKTYLEKYGQSGDSRLIENLFDEIIQAERELVSHLVRAFLFLENYSGVEIKILRKLAEQLIESCKEKGEEFNVGRLEVAIDAFRKKEISDDIESAYNSPIDEDKKDNQ